MRINLPGLFVVFLMISSCCRQDPVETARYELSDIELELIPYSYGQQINFIHSNGYTFQFSVTEDKLEWNEYYRFCEWNCCGQDYFSYQVKTTRLESVYPNLIIELSLGGIRFSDYIPMFLNLNINNRHFISMQYDSTSNFICDSVNKVMCYDSILIHDKSYTNVIEKYFDSHYFIQDSTVLIPESILYNKLGLLQIKMSNDETFSLND
jgi:hypothetical protein